MANIAPVEYMVVAFPGNRFRGEIAPALSELVQSQVIRVIDLAFVMKDQQGNVMAMELEDLDSDTGRAFRELELNIGDLVNQDDLRGIADELEPNSSAAILVWEDLWAAKIAAAISDANGVLLDMERLPREVVEAALRHADSKAELEESKA